MSNAKIIIAIIVAGVLAATFVNKSLSEGFWNIPDRKWKVERVFEQPTPNGPDYFQTPGFQGILSPRFSNVNYGPYLRTQLPDYEMMGVPADPLGGDFGGSFSAAESGPRSCRTNATIVEGFGTGMSSNSQDNALLARASAGSCRGTADYIAPYSSMNVPGSNLEFQAQRVLMDPHNPSAYANGNYKKVVASLMADDNVSDNQGAFGVGDDNFGSYLTADGEMKQPIIYDRFIYANRHSRLRAMGDPIRGDLPIVPNSGNWFVPSVHPNIDLQAGAINVMAGVNNETNHQLSSLIYNSSGGGETTIGGVDLMPVGGVNAFSRMNMSNQNTAATVSAGGDVIVTSFP
jgi:Family of unknown function (DUF5850)